MDTRLPTARPDGTSTALMRRTFLPKTFLRLAMFVLVAVLVWSVWPARAADAVAGIHTPAASSTNQAGPLARELDDFTKKHTDWLSFGLNRWEPLQESYFGRPLWQYIASLFYLFLAFYVSKTIDWLIQSRLKQWAERTETEWDDIVVNLVDGPVKTIAFVIFLHLGLAIFDWPTWLEVWVSKLTVIIVAFAIIVVVLRGVDAALGVWRKKHLSAPGERAFNDQFLLLIGKLFKAFIVVVAVLTTLGHLGIDIQPALASVSVVGLAMGLAAQDTVANLFGAVSVFVDKPFQIGDRIRVGEVDGEVEEMGLRSTRVRSLDGFLITVPNKTIGNTTIVNITRRPTVKTEINLGITYDTTAERTRHATQVLEEIFRAHPRTADVVVTFNKFLDSSLNIQVLHWWQGTDAKLNMADLQDLNLEVKRRFDAERIEFAFPTQTVLHRPVTGP